MPHHAPGKDRGLARTGARYDRRVLFLSPQTAAAVRLSCNRLNLWEGPYGTGKTLGSLLGMFAWIESDDFPSTGDLVMIGYTQESLWENLRPALAMIGGGSVTHKQGEIRCRGHRFRVLGGDSDKGQDRLAGMDLAGAYVDEAGRLAESMFDAVPARLRVAGGRIYATANPTSPAHWLYRRFVKPAGVWLQPGGRVDRGGDNPEITRLTLRPADNPAVSPSFWESLARTYTGPMLARYVRGEWVAATGSVYPDYERAVAKHPAPICTDHTVGVDPGTSHPAAAMLLGRGVDGCVWVRSEWVHDSALLGQRDDHFLVRSMQRWMGTHGVIRPSRLYVDPAANHFRQALRTFGLPATLADNSVVDGINLVASMMATGLLRIDPRCERLIAGLASYQWDEKAQALGEDKPVKEEDDEVDALRYVTYSRSKVYRQMMGLGSPRAA